MDESLSFAAILERVRRAVSQALNVEMETVRADRSIFEISNEDEGPLVAGLYMVQAQVATGDEFHLDIPDEELERLETPYDLARYVAQQLNPQITPVPPPVPPAPSAPPKRSSRASGRQKRPPALPRPDAWTFDHGQWEPVSERNSLEDEGMSSPLLRLGTRQRGFAATVFAHPDQGNGVENGAYRIQLWLGDEASTLFVSDLPSLLSFLGRIAAIAQNTAERKE